MIKSSEEDTHGGSPVRWGRRLKNMGLFLVSPFIALYYALLMPGKLIQLARAEFQAPSTAHQPAEHP